MKIFYLLLVFIGIYSSGQATEKTLKQEKYFTVSGKVINLDQAVDHQTIKFIFGDILEGRKTYIAPIDQAGLFHLEAPCHYSQSFYISYGDLASFLAIPGGSLTLEIDANIWNNKKLEADYIKITGGNTANTNRHIQLFQQEIPNEKYIYRNRSNAEKNKSPEEYIAYIHEREQVYADFARKFNKKYSTSALFRHWQTDQLTYETFEDLMRFHWLYKMYHSEQQDFKFPDNWYHFLKRYNPDDRKVISWAHHGFMSEYERYVFKNITYPSTLRNLSDKFRYQQEYIGNHTKGFTRQILLGKFYLKILESAELSVFDSVYRPELLTDAHVREVISEKQKKIKAIADNRAIETIPLHSINSEVMGGLIDTLAKRYSNKVIYIDFWSTWCGPCLAEMPYSRVIQDHFKNTPDVVFLFLASQCSEKAWKTKIAEQGMHGEHFLLTDDQFNILSATLNINGIPHYALIDRQGNIVDKDAQRPSAKADIINKIEGLLK